MASIPNNWRIFHLLTSKGPNGNPRNIGGSKESPFDLCLPEEHDRWGAGDWEGIRLYVLPWMKNAGFNALQISPITRSIPGVIGEAGTSNEGKIFAPNHAYHTRSLAPNLSSIELEPHFGNKAELIRLIQSAHDMGIKVVADIIPNHLGYEAALVSEHPEFFYSQDDVLLAQLSGDKLREYVVDNRKMGNLPGLRHEHWEVRRRLDVLWIFHINLGFDAFRIDALCHCAEFYQKYLRDLSPLAGYPLLGDAYPLFAENYSGNLFCDDAGHEVNGHYALWQKGYGTTGHPWHFACQEEVSKPGQFADVGRIANVQKALVHNNAQCVGFVDNHDTDRAYTAALEAGNSQVAACERVHAMLVLLYGFVSPPAVLYGTDSLAQGHGVRSVTSCRVTWTPPSSTPTLNLLRKLNRARANYASLESGWYDERYVGSGVLAYLRGLANNDSVIVICNLWDTSVNTEHLEGSIQIGDQFGDSVILRDLTGLATGTFSVIGGRLCGVLPPRSAYLLSVD
jgi:neopullulanase